VHFGNELFTFQQARELLSTDENRLSVAFSKLHSKRALLLFKSGEPRLYRLMNPESFILLASESIKNLDKIPQERYLRLVCDCFRHAIARAETYRLWEKLLAELAKRAGAGLDSPVPEALSRLGLAHPHELLKRVAVRRHGATDPNRGDRDLADVDVSS
jgi:hypothetical protein